MNNACVQCIFKWLLWYQALDLQQWLSAFIYLTHGQFLVSTTKNSQELHWLYTVTPDSCCCIWQQNCSFARVCLAALQFSLQILEIALAFLCSLEKLQPSPPAKSRCPTAVYVPVWSFFTSLDTWQSWCYQWHPYTIAYETSRNNSFSFPLNIFCV